MRILVIDLETTGLDPKDAGIVEVGGVELDGILSAQASLQTLVDPGCPIPPEASAVHHITDGDLIHAVSREGVIKELENFDLYVAHNARFEASFLPELGPWLCTYKAALRLWPEAPSHSLQVLRYWLGMIEIRGLRKDSPMHRALPDAQVTVEVLRELAKGTSLREMRSWTLEPALLPRFMFGKWAKKPLADVPSGYLNWILKQDFDEDVRHTADHELKRRAA